MPTTTIEKPTTMELALRTDKKKAALFGNFTAKLYGETARTYAFAAQRYPYVGSPLCLHLWGLNQDDPKAPYWEPYTDITKNIRPNDINQDEIIVKTYEENEPLRGLLALGFFEDTGRRLEAGFAGLEIWRITDRFISAFDRAYPPKKGGK